MPVYLGIDTSNYTTSLAIYDSDAGKIIQSKQPLPVEKGRLGLRQSDAVFLHTKALGELYPAIMESATAPFAAVGASVRPRDQEDSYMPCFKSGETVARVAASTERVHFYPFSHQAGHIMAGLYGAGRLDLAGKPFIAFHVSGGTTECLLVKPDKDYIFSIEVIGQSLDLKAGQAVDRVGGLLGLSFPAGKELDGLACQWNRPVDVRPSMKGLDCSLSGIQNQCAALIDKGAPPSQVAAFCIASLEAAVAAMSSAALERHPGLPLLYVGGVMSNSQIRASMESRFGGVFAPPDFSADNAAGIAVLCAFCHATSDGGSL